MGAKGTQTPIRTALLLRRGAKSEKALPQIERKAQGLGNDNGTLFVRRGGCIPSDVASLHSSPHTCSSSQTPNSDWLTG
jgi:hypothetical protein